MSGFSKYCSAKVLGHVFANTEFTKPTKVYLALFTVVPTATITGTELESSYEVKSGTVGEYKRIEIPAASLGTAIEGTPSEIKNSGAVIESSPAYTSGSATVIGFAVCDAATAGNVLMWGTTTSTTIGVTNTPAKVETSKLVATAQ